MIETITAFFSALLFGLGISFSLLGLMLMHQIFVKQVQFQSQLLMVQISVILTAIGTGLIKFIAF